MIDYEILSREMVRLLRGEIPQRELSKKMGFSFNQVGKWESGATQIKWADFINLAEFFKLPLEKSFRSLFSAANEKFNHQNSLRVLDYTLNLRTNINYSEYKNVAKWINGTSSPHLSSILAAFDTRPSMLLGWLSYFIDCSQLPALKKPYENFLLRVDTVAKDPNCIFVNAALQVRAYQDLAKHDEVLLAEHAACTVKELRKTLALLLESQIIEWDGKKYLPCKFDFSFSGLPIAKLRNFTKYTTQIAADHYPTVPAKIDPEKTRNSSVSSVRVVAMSPTASRRVGDLIAKFHYEMAEIVKEDQLPKENVQILVLHCFASNIK